MRIGSLFSGAGGLDMAVEAVFGAEVAWHCELDSAASKVLAARWPGVLNHRDITQVNWESFLFQINSKDGHGVDILCAGWPCQPFSLAGKRKGADDERALWPYVAGAVRMVRPRIVVLENVPAVLGPEFQRVANDLAAYGYDIAWTCLRASDVGAPHRRERLFALAYTEGERWTGRDEPRAHLVQDRSEPTHAGSHGRTPADTACDGRHEGRTESTGLVGGSDAALSGHGPVGLLPTPTSRDGKGANQRGDETCLSGALLPTPNAADSHRGPDLARANRDGSGGDDLHTFIYKTNRDEQWGKYEPAIRRWEQVTRPAPAPTEPNTKGNPRLAAAFSEWLMGWPAGWVTGVPGISRNDQLRIIGNGVVSQQATAALRWLLSVSEVAA